MNPNSGRLFAYVQNHTIPGADDGDPVAASRRLTMGDVQSVLEVARTEWFDRYLNLMSTYDQTLPYGLGPSLQAWLEEHLELGAEVESVIEFGTEAELKAAFKLAVSKAFVQALEAGALKRLEIAPWNEQAKAEYCAIYAHAKSSEQGTRLDATGNVVLAKTAPAATVTVDPVQQCAADFHGPAGMGAFKKKYMNGDPKMRAIYEEADRRGLI